MAEIAPFRGLCYNQRLIENLAQVVIPPYDVISSEEQRVFHERSPYNFIRLELGLPKPEDTDSDNPHTRAAAWISQWEQQGILTRGCEPSVYSYELDYNTGPAEVKTRKGFICVLRLEEFSSGKVRPHEKTFQAVKDERLSLMLSCNANLSPVFGIYPDSNDQTCSVLVSGRKREPEISFTDLGGMKHRVWPVSDRTVLKQLQTVMKDKPIFIADGHHRYETALNYRSILRERLGLKPNASYEYIMVYLTSMDEPGLTVLPTHRLIKNLHDLDCERIFEKADNSFGIVRFEPGHDGERKWKDAIKAGGLRKDTAIGLVCKRGAFYCVLTAKRDAVSSLLAHKGVPEPLRTLDVVVLDQLLLRDFLGLSDQFLANEHNIAFMHDFDEALDAVKSSNFDAGFFINHTRIEQVRDVASAGLIMPHKSTYFYPKVISGLVINPLSPQEEIV